MVPSEAQAKALWEKYRLPESKRIHVTLVSRVALFLANRLIAQGYKIDTTLLHVAALLHDIDKAVVRLSGERHPDTAVRILLEEGFPEVSALVKTHPLHAILDPEIMPSTWEEKVLYLSDKMVKYEILTVDKRFDLWRNEQLPEEAKILLENCYPQVKRLEKEVYTLLDISADDVAKFA